MRAPIARLGRSCLCSAAWLAGSLLLVPVAEAGEPAVEVVPATPHGDQIDDVRISNDGRLLVTSSFDDLVKVWDVASRRLLRTVDLKAKGFTGRVTISADGRTLAATSADGRVGIIDLSSGALTRTFGAGIAELSDLAFTPDARRIVIVSPAGAFSLWDAASGAKVRTFATAFGDVDELIVLPDGKRALASHDDGNVRLWDLESGRVVRAFRVHDGKNSLYTGLALAADGRLFASRVGADIRVWDMESGRQVQAFGDINYAPGGLAIDPSGDFLYADKAPDADPDKRDWSKDEGAIEVIDLKSGKEVRTIAVGLGKGHAFALTPDGRFLVHGSVYLELRLYDMATGQEIDRFGDGQRLALHASAAPDGRGFATTLPDGQLQLWSLESGALVRTFEPPRDGDRCTGADGTIAFAGRALYCVLENSRVPAAFSLDTGRYVGALGEPDSDAVATGATRGGTLVSAGDDRSLYEVHPRARVGGGQDESRVTRWDAMERRRLWTTVHPGNVAALAVAPDRHSFATGASDGVVRLWDADTGTLLRSYRDPDGKTATAVAFAEGKLRTVGARAIRHLALDTLQPVAAFPLKASAPATAVSMDGRWAVGAGYESEWHLELADLAQGRIVRSFAGLPPSHRVDIGNPALTPDGRRIVVAGVPAEIGIWQADKNERIASIYAGSAAGPPPATENGFSEWLTMTPEGFFNASSPAAGKTVTIVRGLEPVAVEQLWQSLFNPDLVREKLDGDPDKEVEKAAAVTNLEKVLASGKPPAVEIVSPEAGETTTSDLVTARAAVVEQGGGIGRIEWRVNGVTASVTEAPRETAGNLVAEVALALDPGPNTIEVVAYNGRNLLASLPAKVDVTLSGGTAGGKPKLFVLAIGIDDYHDPGLTDPASGKTLKFKPLRLAVKDAETFGEIIKAAAGGDATYQSVEVRLALDADATRQSLEEAVDWIAARAGPRDTFILYASAHGYSIGGRFYLVPQDYEAEGSDLRASLAARAIGQDRLQDWLVNRVKARKALVLLDTCASGALVADYSQSRTDVPASEAAIGRLHEATGRPVLTAAAGGKEAVEGIVEGGQRHGVFTYALIEALRDGDTNGNGTIELSELAAHVQRRVPEISPTLKFRGRSPITQKPRLGTRGEDFAVVAKLH